MDEPTTIIRKVQNEDGKDLNLNKSNGYKRTGEQKEPEKLSDPYHRDITNHSIKGIV